VPKRTPQHRKYYVTTWDSDRQQFRPQQGVRTGPYTLFGLRRALRKLIGMGFGYTSVRVERDDER
jgi:hypothetical protein